MPTHYLTTKIWKKTLQKLRIIAALRRKHMTEIMDELANEELRHIGYTGPLEAPKEEDETVNTRYSL